MACVWVKDESGWAAALLDNSPVALSAAGVRKLFDQAAEDVARDEALLIPSHDLQGDGWALVAPSSAGVRVNGEPLSTGIHRLNDRDAIQLADGAVYFFSTERVAQVEPSSGAASQTICPRCRQDVAPGTPAVRCPRCTVVHHQSAELPCWAGYEREPFSTCAMCDCPAQLGGGFRWTPEDL